MKKFLKRALYAAIKVALVLAAAARFVVPRLKERIFG